MADVEIGQLLDNKYRIVRLLGEGGMGAVYEGENVRIHHRVAIKVLHPNVAADSGARERFEREAQAAGRIGSEHIVEVYDLGDLPSGARYMVMEFLAGEPLSSRIQSMGRIPPPIVAPLMLQFLDGLGAAHAAGIVHRDIKPDNVFLQRAKGGQDFVKIVDFGVSKFNALSSGAMSMTRTGSLVGTPYYMSPEQVKGLKTIDHRSDLYSAGIVLFECITGTLPFHAETFNELIFKIALEPPLDPEVAVPGLDPAFARIMRRATAREMTERFQTAVEFAQAIADWMQAAGVVVLTQSAPGLPPMRPMVASAPALTGTLANTGSMPSPPTQPNPPVMASSGVKLEKTTTSGSVVTSTVSGPKRSTGAVAAVAAVAVVALAGIGFGVLRASKGAPVQAAAVAPPPPAPSPAAVAPPPATTAEPAPPVAVAPPPAESAPSAVHAPGEPEPSAHPAAHAGASPAHHAAASAAPAASSSAPSSTTIKGRTIRTEL